MCATPHALGHNASNVATRPVYIGYASVCVLDEPMAITYIPCSTSEAEAIATIQIKTALAIKLAYGYFFPFFHFHSIPFHVINSIS